HPSRYDLDSVFPDKPVLLMQTSKHAGTCNSVALRLAGITKDTKNPEGGEIGRDSAGEPTGVLLESAIGMVSRLQPRPDRNGLISAIVRANQELLRAGITSASDLNTGWYDIRT